MESLFRLRDVDRAAAEKLEAVLGIHRVTARCLVGRGVVDADAARRFVRPALSQLRPPGGLADLSRAVDRLARAVRDDEPVGCFGDYDVDGVTTTALLSSYLRALGCTRVSPRVARRSAGYGFGIADADALIGQGARVIITGDCGTSDREAISSAAERDVDVIVIDHHTVPDSTEKHPAHALINPFRSDSTFAFRDMASVGLAFYVMAALRSRLREDGWFEHRKQPDLRSALDLVALGTVADLVPLKAENRILAAGGLRRLRDRRRPGIDALLDLAGVARGDVVDEQTIAWKISPRLNAPGRLGDATPSLELLLAGAHNCRDAAEALETLNDQRKNEQQRVFEEVSRMLDGVEPGPAVVVAGTGWQAGVVGIVASRLVERYHRPAFVIAIDPETGIGRGSCRTVDGFNLYQILSECQEHLMRFGGHAGAAGLTVQASDVGALTGAIASAVVSQGRATEPAAVLVDAEVALADIDPRLVRQLAALGPFGRGNEAPILVARNVEVRAVRRVGDGSHLKLELADGAAGSIPAIAFGLGDKAPGPGARIDIAFAPSISTWGGAARVELVIRDFEPAQSDTSVQLSARERLRATGSGPQESSWPVACSLKPEAEI